MYFTRQPGTHVDCVDIIHLGLLGWGDLDLDLVYRNDGATGGALDLAASPPAAFLFLQPANPSRLAVVTNNLIISCGAAT